MKNPINQDYIKKANRVKVLNILREEQNISRNKLAKITGLTPAAITGIIRSLKEINLVKEIGLGNSKGGRRPVNLQLNQKAGYVIGAEITRKVTTIGIVDLKVNTIKVKETRVEMSNPLNGIKNLALEVEKLLLEVCITKRQIIGYGFAFPGLVDFNSKIIKHSPNLGEAWRNASLKEMLTRYFGTKLFIEHNSNAAAIAEYALQRKGKVRNLVHVNLGEGFSAGVISNGELLYGHGGHAGEIGHMVIDENGPLCNCGNQGCLESIYAVPAIVKKANMDLAVLENSDPLKKLWINKGEVDIKDILSCAKISETYAENLIKSAGWYIGKGIANVINFYNPEVICLGGPLIQAENTLMEPLIKSVNRHAFPELARDTRIEISLLGKQAGFYGACLGAIDNVFTIDGIDSLEII